MNNKNNQYWFYIDSFIHISVKNKNILYYNPYTGKILEFQDNDTALRLTRRLLNPRNLRVIRLNPTDLKIPGISTFVQTIRDYYMGDLIDSLLSDSKPVQMPPKVKVQKDFNYLKNDLDRSPGENLMNYLDEITIHINDTCRQTCDNCSSFYRQMTFCTAKKSQNHFLNLELLKIFFSDIKGCRLSNINITGGNVLLYPELGSLIALLDSVKSSKTIYLHYLNAAPHLKELQLFGKGDYSFKMPVTIPFQENKFEEIYKYSTKFKFDIVPLFPIQCDEEFNYVEDIRSRYPFGAYEYVPFYSGKNLSFFEDNFFTTRQDIETYKPSLRSIYANYVINSFHFGKITVMADEAIHANVNGLKLGKLGKNSLYKCINNEIEKGKNWLKTRRNILPCKSCTYQMLCPPISNYNEVIGKNNLCKIWVVQEKK